jgi:hypothetical protein
MKSMLMEAGTYLDLHIRLPPLHSSNGVIVILKASQADIARPLKTPEGQKLWSEKRMR